MFRNNRDIIHIILFNISFIHNLNLPYTRLTWIFILSVIRKCPCNGLSIGGFVIHGYQSTTPRQQLVKGSSIHRTGLENQNRVPFFYQRLDFLYIYWYIIDILVHSRVKCSSFIGPIVYIHVLVIDKTESLITHKASFYSIF